MSHAACDTVGRSAATRHAEARGKVKRGGRERERARETQALFLPAAGWRSPLAEAKPTRLSHGRHAAARVNAHEHAPTCPTRKLYRGEGGIRRREKPCSGRVGATAVPGGHQRWAHRRRPRRGRLSAIPTPLLVGRSRPAGRVESTRRGKAGHLRDCPPLQRRRRLWRRTGLRQCLRLRRLLSAVGPASLPRARQPLPHTLRGDAGWWSVESQGTCRVHCEVERMSPCVAGGRVGREEQHTGLWSKPGPHSGCGGGGCGGCDPVGRGCPRGRRRGRGCQRGGCERRLVPPEQQGAFGQRQVSHVLPQPTLFSPHPQLVEGCAIRRRGARQGAQGHTLRGQRG
mmetsp:Transcript_17829/g.56349  ORF Transcript_17829/g.56349 Transcript_17829/m.56349 type:complete len:342 (+) Transcript_17829:131-1156(+)